MCEKQIAVQNLYQIFAGIGCKNLDYLFFSFLFNSKIYQIKLCLKVSQQNIFNKILFFVCFNLVTISVGKVATKCYGGRAVYQAGVVNRNIIIIEPVTFWRGWPDRNNFGFFTVQQKSSINKTGRRQDAKGTVFAGGINNSAAIGKFYDRNDMIKLAKQIKFRAENAVVTGSNKNRPGLKAGLTAHGNQQYVFFLCGTLSGFQRFFNVVIKKPGADIGFGGPYTVTYKFIYGQRSGIFVFGICRQRCHQFF